MVADREQMMISAMRYALGRRTYIVGFTCDYIKRYIPDLSHNCKCIMIRDIKEQERFGGYGDECDKKDWMDLLEKLEEQHETISESDKG